MKKTYLLLSLLYATTAFAQTDALKGQVAKKADDLQTKVVSWRRDFHANPELGNHETRTAGIVAAHLKSLGI
jgi:hypothetical protein